VSDKVRIQAPILRQLYRDIFSTIECSESDAKRMSDALLSADLRGLETHGAWRVPQYVELARAGLANVKPTMNAHITGPTTAVIDGDDGFGQIVAQRALETAMEMAAVHGTATVVANRANHVGTLYYFARQAVEQGFIAILTTNSPPNMAPWGGTTPVLGTNPFCLAVPGADGHPIILDMATSVAAKAKILVAQKEHRPIPEGWALDVNGLPTTDASMAAAGTVMPIGGAKGYGLALMVDVLSGVLSGAGFGHDAYYAKAPKKGGLGLFFSLYAIDRFMDPSEFEQRITHLSKMITDSPPAPGVDRVTLPGEHSRQIEEGSLRDGVTLNKGTALDLQRVADSCGHLLSW
jgi:LDH2 family malate/lactate/ureidoglycolate dehydrogenase